MCAVVPEAPDGALVIGELAMIGVLVSGEGTNLQALIDAGLPIAAVASNRSDAAALERADAAGIPNRVFELDRYADREARDRELAEWLQLRGVELVVLAGYMHLLTPAFLDRFPDRIVNVHPSLLPAVPGRAGDRRRAGRGRRDDRRHRPLRRRRARHGRGDPAGAGQRSSRATRW